MNTLIELVEGDGRDAERSQREGLGGRERDINLFQKRVERFLKIIPVDFAQTEAGTKLIEALEEVDNFLTGSRRSIRGETDPLEKD